MKKITFMLCAGICLLACSIAAYGQSIGDVDSSGSIDIVDALLIAQYYVGLNPGNFNSSVADTDCSGEIDIVDALLVAQYYVGLISQFPCSTTPAPTASNLINAALTATSSTSYVSDWESIDALNNGIDPANSNDTSNLAYGNWPETGTQWVQYDFNQIYDISSMEVYWFDDDDGIDVPSSCRLLYNNGQGLVEVPNPDGYGTAANQYNVTTFSTISTSQVKLEMISNGSSSTGILEWKVWGSGGSPTTPSTPDPTPDPTAVSTPVPTSVPGDDETLADCPSHYRSALDWIWTNRIVNEGSTNRRNIIFDQIYAGNGELHYCVRWQSNLSVSLQKRQEIASMIARQITNWTRHLTNYDGWPYDHVNVIVVSYACANSSLIQNLQSNEILYTDWINDPLHNDDPSIPQQLPVGPGTCSRFDHFNDPNYTYSSCPGGPQNRFDMYLWGTTNFGGGAGGDWGQRMNDSYILNNSTGNEVTIIEHEIGHGFGLTDFYGEHERPPGGFPDPTIMWAGNSSTITEFDKWMLRYVWSQLKNDTSRFPPR